MYIGLVSDTGVFGDKFIMTDFKTARPSPEYSDIIRNVVSGKPG